MTCQKSLALIHEYLDGDISADEKKQLFNHVEQCSECKSHLRGLEKTEIILKSHSRVEAPDDFTQRVMQSIPNDRKQERVKVWMKAHPVIVAASLFIFLMAGSMFSIWSSGPQQISVSAPNIDQLVVDHEQNMVIVPDHVKVEGNLIVQHGNVEVQGEVSGDVIVTDGQVYQASTAHIVGQVEEIDQFFKWAWFNVQKWIKEAIPNRE